MGRFMKSEKMGVSSVGLGWAVKKARQPTRHADAAMRPGTMNSDAAVRVDRRD